LVSVAALVRFEQKAIIPAPCAEENPFAADLRKKLCSVFRYFISSNVEVKITSNEGRSTGNKLLKPRNIDSNAV